MAESSTAQEIERAITQALARKGVGGTVVVRDEHCELHNEGAPIAIELGDWVGQWNLLPEDIRDNRAEKAATRLVNAMREAQGKAVRIPAADLLARYKRVATYLGGVVVAALALHWLYRASFFGRPGGEADADAAESAASARASAEVEARDEAARVRRVCEAARQRLFQGAALGVDIQGFVVELWLARDGAALASDEGLRALVGGGFVADVGAKGPSEVTLHPGDGELGLATATVRFEGGYVAPFFDASGRERYHEVAERLADAGGAVYGALFARCAHLPGTRDVGAWYRGNDERAAVVSLLYGAGQFVDPPAFELRKLEDGGVLTNLRRGVASLDPEARDDILRKAGGRVFAHRPKTGGAAVSIRFPLGGPRRPVSASRELARLLGY